MPPSHSYTYQAVRYFCHWSGLKLMQFAPHGMVFRKPSCTLVEAMLGAQCSFETRERARGEKRLILQSWHLPGQMHVTVNVDT